MAEPDSPANWAQPARLWRQASRWQRIQALLPPLLIPLSLGGGGTAAHLLTVVVGIICFVSAAGRVADIGIRRLRELPAKPARLALWRLPAACVLAAVTYQVAVGSHDAARRQAMDAVARWVPVHSASRPAPWVCETNDACQRPAGWPVARYTLAFRRESCQSGPGLRYAVFIQRTPFLWTEMAVTPDRRMQLHYVRDNNHFELDPETLDPTDRAATRLLC